MFYYLVSNILNYFSLILQSFGMLKVSNTSYISEVELFRVRSFKSSLVTVIRFELLDSLNKARIESINWYNN